MQGSNTLNRWEKGQAIRARTLNEVVDEVNRIGKGVNAPAQKSSDSKGKSAASMRQFKILSIEADHLICNTFDGTAQGTENFKVAKSYLLRQTPFDGETRAGLSYVYSASTTRVATLVETETQVVVPSYVVSDIIYAAKQVKGGVGVTVTTDGVTEKLEWLDLNIDGRAWAKQTA